MKNQNQIGSDFCAENQNQTALILFAYDYVLSVRQ